MLGINCLYQGMSIIRYHNRNEKIYSRKRLRFPKLQMNKKFEFRSSDDGNKKRKIAKILIIVVVEIFMAKNMVSSINPIINRQCINQAKNIATIISNEQATIVMEKYKYEDLAITIKDENGKIQMIKLNVIPVNEIISDVAIRIQGALSDTESAHISVRLGSFSGIKLLSGVGPKINFKISSVGNVETNLKSEFKTAGINQTLHQIYLEIKCNVQILTPYETINEEIINQILIAESIILGDIPLRYYDTDKNL